MLFRLLWIIGIKENIKQKALKGRVKTALSFSGKFYCNVTGYVLKL